MARFLNDPRLTALDDEEACEFAVSVRSDAQVLTPSEYGRLYDLALDAERAR